jgi:hypothetical protein
MLSYTLHNAVLEKKENFTFSYWFRCVHIHVLHDVTSLQYLALCTGLYVQLFLKPRICNQGEHTLLLFISNIKFVEYNIILLSYLFIYGSTALCWTLAPFSVP